MRIVFAGTPAPALPVLEALAGVHEVAAVITRPPAPRGRSGRPVATPVQRWADERGVEVLAPADLRSPGFVGRLAALAPQCCPVVAYGRLITPELLALPEGGWINLHFSWLPAYRGAAPVQRALLDGCTTTGITTFRLVAALDAGPVFVQERIDIAESDTAGDLLAKASAAGARAMLETLERLARGEAPVEQPESGASLAPKVAPEEARLDFTAPAAAVVNRVRAMSPEPGAWALLGGERFKVLRAAAVAGPGQETGETAAGELRATRTALFARAGDGWVQLVSIQPAGRREMAGADWARGAWRAGDRLA